MKNILIIGGAGFIGSNTANYFLNKGHSVTIIDDLSRKGSEFNIKWLKNNNKSFDFVKCDIVNDLELLQLAIKNKEIIFHFAGQVAVTNSIENPNNDFMINALGTLNILENIRLFNNDAILLYSSTNKVYGNLANIETEIVNNKYQFTKLKKGINEETPLDFYSPYGCSKGSADQYVRDYARIYNLKTIIFRQSCIYGYRQMGIEDQGWLAWFTIASILNKQITIYGNGSQVRDILFIDDLVRAFDLAVSTHETYGEVYNIGGGPHSQLSLLELISILENKLDKTINKEFSDKRLGDQSIFICDINKAKLDFKWEPKINIEDGIESLIKWIRENKILFSKYL